MAGPFIFRYRPAAVISAAGEDVFSFLQGQFSNDLRPRSPGKVTYGLWLDVKGKVEGDSFVIERGGTFLIVSPRCPAAGLRARLERFIVADDVTLVDETERWSSIVAWGDGAASSAALLQVEIPSKGVAFDNGTIVGFSSHRWGGGTIEWLFESSEGEAGVATESLMGKGFKVLTEAGAEQERILRGGVAVPEDLGASDLPQEAGIEEIAVSFNKGCFIGQEVMARLRSMGRVRRGLIHVRGEGKVPTVPAELFSGDRRMGDLRSVAPIDAGGFVGLAMATLMDLPDVLTIGRGEDNFVRVVRPES